MIDKLKFLIDETEDNPKLKSILLKVAEMPENKQEMTLYEHPTVKPLDMIKMIVKASSNEGDIVLDAFMGSGTTAVACLELNRKLIGFEISKEYCDIANKRLQQENLGSFIK